MENQNPGEEQKSLLWIRHGKGDKVTLVDIVNRVHIEVQRIPPLDKKDNKKYFLRMILDNGRKKEIEYLKRGKKERLKFYGIGIILGREYPPKDNFIDIDIGYSAPPRYDITKISASQNPHYSKRYKGLSNL